MQTDTCASCGIQFGMPDNYTAARRKDGKRFYCPNGHRLTYGDGENEEIRRERDRLKQQVARAEDYADHHKRSAAAYQGQVTKLKKRAKAGVCSCCNRTFQNLADHMKTKHADMNPEAPLKVIDGARADG